MFEENVKNSTDHNFEQGKEFNIVLPMKQTVSAQVNNDCAVDEPELSVAYEPNESVSSDDYKTADNDCSETESDNEIVLPNNEPYRTRGGRVVKPPNRYGWN